MGWAQGLQSGMALGNLINQGFDRRELAEEAKKHQIDETMQPDKQEAVSGLVAQRDARAQELLDKGADANTAYQQATQELLPQFQDTSKAAGLSTQYGYGGQTYADRGEAERALSAGRTQGLANVYRLQGNEEQASALEARALQNRAAGLQVNKLQRDEDTEIKIQNVDKQAGDFLTKRLTGEDGTLRAATPDDMIAQIQHRATLLQKNGMGREAIGALKDWQGIAVNAIQLNTAQRNEELGRVATAIAAGDLKPAQAFYDKHVLDGAKVTALTTNKDGSISVSRVRDDGMKLPDTRVGSANELLATLNSFRDPMSLYNFSQNEFKNNLAVKELGIKQQTANQVGEYYKSRTGIERMGSAQYFQGEDNNTYASVPVMGKDNKVRFETVKVNPDDIKMKKAGAANDGKPVKIEDEGTKMSIGGKTVIADGNGNWIPADGNGRPQGVLPSERTKVLKDAGVPDNLVGQLPWNKTGTGVLLNGKEYNPKDPKDLKLLTETYKRLGAASIAMEEATARDVALQQRFRALGGQQPSVMTEDPDLWSLYRNQERNRGLVPRFPE